MRLDVQINTASRVAQLLVRHTGNPAHLPPVKVEEETAAAAALKALQAPKQAKHVRVADGELLVVQREGHWRVQWLFAFAADDKTIVLDPAYVDATTGETVDRPAPQQSLDTAPTKEAQDGSSGVTQDGPPPKAARQPADTAGGVGKP